MHDLFHFWVFRLVKLSESWALERRPKPSLSSAQQFEDAGRTSLRLNSWRAWLKHTSFPHISYNNCTCNTQFVSQNEIENCLNQIYLLIMDEKQISIWTFFFFAFFSEENMGILMVVICAVVLLNKKLYLLHEREQNMLSVVKVSKIRQKCRLRILGMFLKLMSRNRLSINCYLR